MKFEISFKVGPSHLDSEGRLSVRSMIDMMQDCSIFQLDSEAQLAAYFKETNSGMFLSQRQIEMRRMPVHGEVVRVVTWVYNCNFSFGYRNTNIYDANEEVCVCSSAVGVFVDYGSGRPIRVPEEIIASVPKYDPFEMEYLPRKISIPKDVVAEELPTFYVWKFLIDANKHVNNARYVSVAQECLPDDYAFTRIRVEYLTPAKYGDVLHPKLMCVSDKFIVILEDGNGGKYAVVEFS